MRNARGGDVIAANVENSQDVTVGKNIVKIRIGTLVAPATPVLIGVITFIALAAVASYIAFVPARMPTNDFSPYFNVVVAEFGQLDAQGRAQPSPAGLVIQVTSSDTPDFNGFWEGAAEFTPIRDGGASVAQGCRQGQAQIRSPRSGSRLSGIVSIRGSATCDHFDYYKFEFEDARCDKGICFVAGPFRPGVVNGELMLWNTRTVPNGQYMLRVVVGQNGAIFRQIARIRVNIAN